MLKQVAILIHLYSPIPYSLELVSEVSLSCMLTLHPRTKEVDSSTSSFLNLHIFNIWKLGVGCEKIIPS